MELNTMLEVVTAAHLAYLVDAPKEFSDRGGLMFVAPPGHCKTVIVKTLEGFHPSALVLGDLTIRQLVEIRDEISSGKIVTLAFSEVPKLYGRNPSTALNLEGALHQMAAEGFGLANWEDQRLIVRGAKALVVGAMPPDFQKKHFTEWLHSGFLRRFLWCHFQLANNDAVTEAIRNWKPIQFGKVCYFQPAVNSIPFAVDPDETMIIEDMLRRSKTGVESIPYGLMKKILSVLKWRHSEAGKKKAAIISMEILVDFAPCLREVVDLNLPKNIEEIERKPSRSTKRA